MCTGKPDGPTPTTPATANLKIRQAIAAAYNPQAFNDRVYSGKGLAETSLFQKSFPWDPGVAGPKYDLELAKRLVAEAKAAGWNGSVRVLFTNSAVLTGAVAKSELDVRASIGAFLLVPPGLDEEAITAAGLALLRRDDRTPATAEIAARWHAVRARHATALEREEGADWFAQRQRYLEVTAELAASRRLSRILYLAEEPVEAAPGS